MKTPKTIIIPAMLDAHFDLFPCAFETRKQRMVVLKNRENLAKIGLRYAHNDMCYPAILIVGQLIAAIRNGEVDPSSSVFLIPQAGDCCRGSGYLHLIRKALKRANLAIPVIPLNFLETHEEFQFHLTPVTLWKSFAAVYTADLLMILANQVQPYEATCGATQALCKRKTAEFQQYLRSGKHLSPTALLQKWREIASDFAKIPKLPRKLPRIGIVGELYIKYCSLGNHDLLSYLIAQGAEPAVHGFSWYVLYYIRSHLTELSLANPMQAALYGVAGKYLAHMQQKLVAIVRHAGFACPEAFPDFETHAREHYTNRCNIGDGWLIGAEICSFSQMQIHRVACVQPFGCMANHVAGRGIYASLQRGLPNLRLAVLDFDASGSDVLWQNRLQMLFEEESGSAD